MVDGTQMPRPMNASLMLNSREQLNNEQHLQAEAVVTRETTNPSSVMLRKSRSNDDFLNQDEMFSQRIERPSSWTSPNEPVEPEVVQRSSRIVEPEISRRVYDSVDSVSAKQKPEAVGGKEYNKLVYQGYPKRKVSVDHSDSLAFSSLYSRLNSDKNPTQNEASNVATSAQRGTVDQRHQMGQQQLKTEIDNHQFREVDKQQGFPMGEIRSTNEKVSSSPLYSNVSTEMNEQSKPIPVYSVPDMKKKRQDRQNKQTVVQPFALDEPSPPMYSNVEAERSNMLPFQSLKSVAVHGVPDVDNVKPSQRHLTLPSCPLYSNVKEERPDLVQSVSGPVYSLPDIDKKWAGRHKKRQQQQIAVNEHKHQEFSMKELPSQCKTTFSSPLYSNTNAEMHPVDITESQNLTSVYNVPDMNAGPKKSREATRKISDHGINREAQAPSQHTTFQSPVLPSSLEMAGSMHCEQTTAFDMGEPTYPSLSVPLHLQKAKELPSEVDNVSPDSAHIYDFPKRKDIYKPLPLEGLYDIPSSIPKQEFTEVSGSHYDMPSSLSLVAMNKTKRETAMQADFPFNEGAVRPRF